MATKQKNSQDDIMNCDMSIVRSAERTPILTPEMWEMFASSISRMLMICGIKSISVAKFASGYCSNIQATVDLFESAPIEVKTMGATVKDSVASLMAIANIQKMAPVPNEKQKEFWLRVWNESAQMVRSGDMETHPFKRLLTDTRVPDGAPSQESGSDDAVEIDFTPAHMDTAKPPAKKSTKKKSRS